MTNEIVVMGHNDLDQVGCLLSIYAAFPDKNIIFFECNYQNMLEVMDNVERYIQQHNTQTLFVTDLAFPDELNYIQRLSKMAPEFLWIDHHEYQEGYFENIDFKYFHDYDRSATKITYELFSKLFKTEDEKYHRLHQIMELTDIYDLWKTESPHFNAAQDLNNFSKTYSTEAFARYLHENDYKLPHNFKAYVEQYNADKQAHIDKLEKNNLIFRNGKISVIFTDDYINECVIREFEEFKPYVVMIVNSYGLIRFRLSREENNEWHDEIKSKVKQAILQGEQKGHLHAFTIKIYNTKFDNLMKEIEKYTNIIQGEFK